jgi:transposase-like protein
MPKKVRRFSRETKLALVRRLLAGENVTALSREVNILHKDLYKSRANFLSGGPAALKGPGRPQTVAGAELQAKSPSRSCVIERTHRRIAELERESVARKSSSGQFRSPCSRLTPGHGRTTEGGTEKPRLPQHGTK